MPFMLEINIYPSVHPSNYNLSIPVFIFRGSKECSTLKDNDKG